MHRLKFDNDTLRKVSKLVLYHDDRMPATMKHVRRAMNRISAELFPYYMKVRMADTLAQSDYQRDKKLENLAGIEKCYQEILEKKQCVSLKELKVNGQDLIAADTPDTFTGSDRGTGEKYTGIFTCQNKRTGIIKNHA